MIAIPCHNCAPQIARVLAGFNDRLLSRVDQVVVIDNASPDNTALVAKDVVESSTLLRNSGKFAVFRNRANYNLGGTFKLAWFYAISEGYDALIFLHGDAQADTLEAHSFLDELEDDVGATAAFLGARFMVASKLVNYSRSRELANRALNLVFSAATLRSVHDIGSGLNLYRIPSVDREAIARLPDHPAFDVDLLLYYVRSRAKVKFVPITWREEDQVSNVKNLQIGLTVLGRLLRWRAGLLHSGLFKPTPPITKDQLAYDQIF